MTLASGLLWWADRWYKTVGRFDDMPGPAPAFRLCISINSPVALVRALWIRYASAVGDYLMLVLAVGALWYWVALNVETWRWDRAVLMFRWEPLRLVADLLLVALGVFWGLTFVAEGRIYNPQPWPLSSWLWMAGVLGPLLGWSLGLFFFFGRDFVHCLRKKPAHELS